MQHSSRIKMVLAVIAMACVGTGVVEAGAAFQEAPILDSEWGFHPEEGETIRSNPAPFAWKMQKEAVSYELQYSQDSEFQDAVKVMGMKWPVWCASSLMEKKQGTAENKWYWRVRFTDKAGEQSEWSRTRCFTIRDDAYANPMPPVSVLLGRIPEQHPRIFVRPEQLEGIRGRLTGDLKPIYDRLLKHCDTMLAGPVDTSEPPKYDETTPRGSREWMNRWWGNRMKIIRVLGGAAELGYAWRLNQDERYGQLAKNILMECAQWDPNGSTSMTYNDEAGMPYLSRFSRTYSYVYPLLTEAEREQCRGIVRQRGLEVWKRLYPKHFSQPFNSHNNRLWHFLGEAGVVFYKEIPEAADWLEAAMNVYFCVYPVWGDDDGGWHEGPSYWYQYLERFFWWGDILNNTFQIDIAQKPFFHKTGDFALYQMQPHSNNGGFADLGHLMTGFQHMGVMSSLACFAQNPYYQWYAETIKSNRQEDAYIAILRATRKAVVARPPVDLPTSKVFKGNGLAFMNTSLVDARDNVQILFKSSPTHGTASHGYDANNSFLFNYMGRRLLIRSGQRDQHGSNFHKNWMWETKSENNITVNGQGQKKMSRSAHGRIVAFETTPQMDYVCGEAGESYPETLDSFQRQILFLKPSAVVIVDTLKAKQPSIFNWHLHAINAMDIHGRQDIRVHNSQAHCRVEFLHPMELKITQTDKYDTPPMPYMKVVHHHLTADTLAPDENGLFITVIRPYRQETEADVAQPASLRKVDDGNWEIDIPVGSRLFQAKMDAKTYKISAK